MGDFDIPAMIEKILQVTQHEKIFYVGNLNPIGLIVF